MRGLICGTLTSALIACGGPDITQPTIATRISAVAGSGQRAAASTAVTTPPSVQVADAPGNGVAGVAVTFAVASGGGMITGGSATTNPNGIAAVGSWTLGWGPNALTASASGLSGSPVTGSLAVGVVNGSLYAVGGGGDGPVLLNTVYAYDPTSNTWSTKAPMLTARSGLGVGVVNGILYAVGGDNGEPLTTVEAYDPATNSWTTKAPMPTPRYFLGIGVISGLLYAVGGQRGPADGQRPYATVEVYQP